MKEKKASEWNTRRIVGLVTGLLHFVQFVVVFMLLFLNENIKSGKGTFKLYYAVKKFNYVEATANTTANVTTNYEYKTAVWWDIPAAIVVFFALSSVMQLIETIVYGDRKHILVNIRLRYFEYAVSAAVMIICIAIEVGIQDLYLLLCMAILISATNMLGYAVDVLQESLAPATSVWISHGVAWVTCLTPYAMIGTAYGVNVSNNRSPPLFVHGIVFSMFVQFCSFGFVQVWDMYERQRQYSLVNKDPLNHLEKVAQYYDILSLTAKTTLAWLVLAPIMQNVMPD